MRASRRCFKVVDSLVVFANKHFVLPSIDGFRWSGRVTDIRIRSNHTQ